MLYKRCARLITLAKNCSGSREVIPRRNATTTSTGAILPEPERNPFGLFAVISAVVPGLLIGAAISKTIANFLEENELFVPSDDDDDDD